MSKHHTTVSYRRRQQLTADVVAEHGLVCVICSKLIDPNAADVRARLSVEHLRPVSRGGSYFDLRNCRPAHRGCNSSRGNRAVTVPAPAKHSRSW